MAYNIFTPIPGPNVSVSLFGDATSAGAAAAKNLPSITSSIIKGAKEGYEWMQDREEQSVRIDNNRAVAEQNQIKAREAQYEEQLRLLNEDTDRALKEIELKNKVIEADKKNKLLLKGEKLNSILSSPDISDADKAAMYLDPSLADFWAENEEFQKQGLQLNMRKGVYSKDQMNMAENLLYGIEGKRLEANLLATLSKEEGKLSPLEKIYDQAFNKTPAIGEALDRFYNLQKTLNEGLSYEGTRSKFLYEAEALPQGSYEFKETRGSSGVPVLERVSVEGFEEPLEANKQLYDIVVNDKVLMRGISLKDKHAFQQAQNAYKTLTGGTYNAVQTKKTAPDYSMPGGASTVGATPTQSSGLVATPETRPVITPVPGATPTPTSDTVSSSEAAPTPVVTPVPTFDSIVDRTQSEFDQKIQNVPNKEELQELATYVPSNFRTFINESNVRDDSIRMVDQKASQAIRRLDRIPEELRKEISSKNTLDIVNKISSIKEVSDAPNLIKAIIGAESAGNPKAISPTGVKGLMQVTKDAAKDAAKFVGRKKAFNRDNTKENILAGTAYLNFLLDKFEGNLDVALMAYNGGPGRINMAVRSIGGYDMEGIKAYLEAFSERNPESLPKAKVKEILEYPDRVKKFLLAFNFKEDIQPEV